MQLAECIGPRAAELARFLEYAALGRALEQSDAASAPLTAAFLADFGANLTPLAGRALITAAACLGRSMSLGRLQVCARKLCTIS